MKVLGSFCRRGLNGCLETDGHDPLAVALDPQATDMNRLARVGLVQAGHDDRVAKIKHLRRHERRRRAASTGLLLRIQRGDAIRFGERMIVCGTQHGEFVRNVRRPSGRVMIGYSRFQRLPGSDDGLLGFVLWLVGNGLAGILAVGYAGTR